MCENVAICTIVRNEAPYLAEWIRFHQLMGVRRFRIYDNESTDEPDCIVEQFAASLAIDLVSWSSGRTWRETQRSAYIDGLTALANCQFVAFIDVDEFLCDNLSESLPVALSEFGCDVGAIAVCQRVFGSNGLIEFDGRPVTERFTSCAQEWHPENRWFKSIVRPRDVLDFDSSHSVILGAGRYVLADGGALRRSMAHPGISDRICEGPIRLNHYIIKSLEEFRMKQARWRGTSLESRYNDEFFLKRDAYCNEVSHTSLVGAVGNAFFD